MKEICVFIDIPYGAGGVFQYNQQILSALLSLPSNYRITVFYVEEQWAAFIPSHANKVRLKYSNKVKLLLKSLFGVGAPSALMRVLFSFTDLKKITTGKFDLSFFPSQDLAGLFLTDNAVNVVHDLMHRYESQFKESTSWGRGRFRDKLYSSMANFSKIVLVDSNIGKQQLIDSYDAVPGKIKVLPYIAPSHITQYDDKEHREYFEKLKLPPAFIFYPAQYWPHKNHIVLLHAAKTLIPSIPDLQLVFTGPKRFEYEALRQYVENNGLSKHVTFIDYVPNNVLGGFYKRARAMVMPTFYGPTNIPPLEAVALQCPVAVSRIYGMPEQLGNASLFFNNTDVADVATTVEKLWTRQDLREELIRNQQKHFMEWNESRFNEKLRTIVEEALNHS